MMVSILLRYSGICKNYVEYKRFKSDGIIVKEDISIINLKAAIAAELGGGRGRTETIVIDPA